MPKAVAQKASAAVKVSKKRKVNGYQMPERIPIGTILTDLSKQQWKIGPSIGVGGFGEIYCACKANEAPKKHEDYPYVVKVVSFQLGQLQLTVLFDSYEFRIYELFIFPSMQEPHGNGPLFVEMHFYMRNGKLTDSKCNGRPMR